MGRPVGSKNVPKAEVGTMTPTLDLEAVLAENARLKERIDAFGDIEAEMAKFRAEMAEARTGGEAVAQQDRNPSLKRRTAAFVKDPTRWYKIVEGDSPHFPKYESPLHSFLSEISEVYGGDKYYDHGFVSGRASDGAELCTNKRQHLLSMSIDDYKLERKQVEENDKRGFTSRKDMSRKRLEADGALVSQRPTKWLELSSPEQVDAAGGEEEEM